jgi:hypothetical protein
MTDRAIPSPSDSSLVGELNSGQSCWRGGRRWRSVVEERMMAHDDGGRVRVCGLSERRWSKSEIEDVRYG